MYVYRVVEDYREDVPQTSSGVIGPFLCFVLHDTEGGVGDSGALGTLRFLIDRKDRNASYHELWSWEEATRVFTARRIVPPTSAAHSLNPFPPSQGGSYEPDAYVRESLGARVNDPNRVVYAVSLAGTKADVDRWSEDSDFVKACLRRLAELRAELRMPNRKAEHFRFNPSTRSDWGKLLTPAINREEMWVRILPVQEQWTTKLGARFYAGGPEGVGIPKHFNAVVTVTSIAETDDNRFRLVAWNNEILFVERAGLTPISGTRNPAEGYGAPLPIIKEVIKEVPTGITQSDLDKAVAVAQESGLKAGITNEKSRLRKLLGL